MLCRHALTCFDTMLVITGEVQVLTCGQNQWWLRTVGQPREQFPDVDIFLPPLAGHFLPGEGPVAGAVASFANTSNTTAADAARQAGQTLGLYTSGFPCEQPINCFY